MRVAAKVKTATTVRPKVPSGALDWRYFVVRVHAGAVFGLRSRRPIGIGLPSIALISDGPMLTTEDGAERRSRLCAHVEVEPIGGAFRAHVGGQPIRARYRYYSPVGVREKKVREVERNARACLWYTAAGYCRRARQAHTEVRVLRCARRYKQVRSAGCTLDLRQYPRRRSRG
jgi:hypothetical protein